MDRVRLVHGPHDIATSEQLCDIRARAWAFVFDCHAKKKAADKTSTNGDNAMKGSIDDRARHIIQEPK